MNLAFSLETEKKNYELDGVSVEGYVARIPKLVSRKKQLIPPLSLYAEQM